MIEDIKKCTGCGACKACCPKDAITIEMNENGFWSPVVDKSKCVNCGKCRKICPDLNYKSKNKTYKCYAVAASDEERKDSASGAFFPILAKYVLRKTGYVCGVAWNDNWEAEHIIIDNEADLYKLRSSKYVQSNTKNCFREIKKLLENDKYVLFSGTPCQNAGLISYLGKDYEKLITCDLLCMGVPSPKVWSDYLETNFDKTKITNINFRKKDNGWELCYEDWFNDSNSSSIDTDDGRETSIGIYFEAFIKHLINNDCCMECKYKPIPRPADFTCGDFWAYYKYNKKLNDKKGLSLISLNNKKAERIFKEIKDTFPLKKRIYRDKWLKIKSNDSKERKLFFKKYREGNLNINQLLNAGIKKHYDIGVASFFNGINYGSALVSYATNRIFEELGYSTLMINKRMSHFYDFDKCHTPANFALRNYFVSDLYDFNESACELNDICDNFIVTSDTLWWWQDVKKTGYHFWLDFVNSFKRKISFCTSFAHNKTDIPELEIPQLKYLYSRFDAISTREDAGVDILKNVFGVNGVGLCDPTLVVKPEVFDELIAQSKLKEEGKYLFAYILDISKSKEKKVRKFAEKLGLKVIFISKHQKWYYTDILKKQHNNYEIEDFIYLLKNAEFVLTDSFHGTCFSLIFKKKFRTIINNSRGSARYKIFYDMGIEGHLLKDFNNLENIDIEKMPDFDKVDIVIDKKREETMNFIKSALSAPIKTPDKSDLLYDFLERKKIKTKISKKELERLKRKYSKYKLIKTITFGRLKIKYTEKYKRLLNELQALGILNGDKIDTTLLKIY